VNLGTASRGARLFARYAYAPNELGYCGPAQSQGLLELGATGRCAGDPHELARGFSGAWPYLRILAELSGIEDPLAEPVVRAYWLGGGLLERIDPVAFGTRLLAVIGPQAGHYWGHLSADLLSEASPTHGFHVFGVYPWSRLLAGPGYQQPLHVLDRCRIRWGEVLSVEAEHVVVRSRRLAWDGQRLQLGAAEPERVRRISAQVTFVNDPRPGQWLSLHWDWVCDRLDPADVAQLLESTMGQLAATNRRLRPGPD
jgi:hypothetical protein